MHASKRIVFSLLLFAMMASCGTVAAEEDFYAREPALWPVGARALAWPGMAIGLTGRSVALVTNPATVLGIDRSYTEFAVASGWALSTMGTFTQVLSMMNGALGFQISGETSRHDLLAPPVQPKAVWGNLSLGAAGGYTSGLGVGLTSFYDPAAGAADLRLSGGILGRIASFTFGGALVNAVVWSNRKAELRTPERLLLLSTGIRVTPWLEIAGDVRAVVRRHPRTTATGGYSLLTRRLGWAPGRFAAGVVLRPTSFLELATRYDSRMQSAFIGGEFGIAGWRIVLSAGRSFQDLPLLVDTSGKAHSQRSPILGIAVTRQFGLTRREKAAHWRTRQLRKLAENASQAASWSARTAAARQSVESEAESDSSKRNISMVVEGAGKTARRAFTGAQALRTIARLDSLRKLYARKVKNSAPVVDPETANWQAEAINLGPAVNSRWDDFSPSVTVDGRELLFTSNRLGGIGTRVLENGEVSGTEDFWISNRIGEKWGPAKNLGRPINTEGAEGAPCIAADGQRIYFVKCAAPDGYGHCDIYVAELKGNEWLSPKNLGPAINTPFWEAHPSISADGRTLYFAREDTFGTNIWFSVLVDTGWTKAQMLGPAINSPFNEVSPFIHADGRTLYFSSDRPGGYGGYDLYVSVLTDSGWSQARNLGPWINTEFDDKYLAIPGAGNTAFFASSKEGGLGKLDIYEIELPPSMRPKPVTTVKGRVLDAATGKPIEAEIHLRSLDTGEDVAVARSNAATGEYLVVLPSAHVYSVLARARGYVDYTERYEIKIQDAYREIAKDFYLHRAELVRRIRRKVVDPVTGQPVPAQVQIKRLSDGQTIGQAFVDLNSGEVVVDVPADEDYGLFYTAPGYTPFSERLVAGETTADSLKLVNLQKLEPEKEVKFEVNLIFFDFDSDKLRKESTAELLQAVAFLKEHPDVKVEIQGHTDDVGPAEYNLDLSQRRADAVKQFLVGHGIDSDRLIAKGYGESMPKVPNTSDENRAKNRRVEFRVLRGEQPGLY